jgi:hypothetical protein
MVLGVLIVQEVMGVLVMGVPWVLGVLVLGVLLRLHQPASR